MSQPNQTADRLKVALCTREFPPDVYGGAGVHVEYLAKELSNYVNLTVECQGAERSTAVAHQPWDRLQDTNSALQTISTELSMVADMNNADGRPNSSAAGTRCRAGPNAPPWRVPLQSSRYRKP